jgi:hypothetical protein
MDNLERNLDLILAKYKGKLEENFSVISAQNKMTSSLFYLLGKKCYSFNLFINLLFYVLICYVMLCYVMLYSVMLCHVILYYILPFKKFYSLIFFGQFIYLLFNHLHYLHFYSSI